MEKNGKNVAKFKQTDNVHTTTNTASILGYYHVARALGDICEIKPAILRTMDIEQHKQMVRLAAELGAHGLVGQSWALFNHYYANPSGSAVARTLFTSDFKQIYGALLENTTGEENYAEWLNAGSDLSNARLSPDGGFASGRGYSWFPRFYAKQRAGARRYARHERDDSARLSARAVRPPDRRQYQ